jgi:hypothetical protein
MLRVDEDEPIWLLIRERPQQDSIDEAEHPGIRSNAERKREDDRQREAGASGERPSGIAKIVGYRHDDSE